MAITVQQHAIGHNDSIASGTNETYSLTNNFGTSNLVVAVVTYVVPTDAEPTRSVLPASGSETWTEGVHRYSSGNDLGISMWYCLSPSGTNKGVIAKLTTGAGNHEQIVDLIEFTGQTGWAFDNSSLNNASTSTPAAISFTPTFGNDLIVSGLLNQTNIPTAGTVPANNAIEDSFHDTTAGVYAASEWGTQSGGGAIAPNFTLTTSAAWALATIAFTYSRGFPSLTLLGCGTK